MASVIQTNFRLRKTFARLDRAVEVPNLIDIQKRSFDLFLQADVAPEAREDVGLQAVFKSVFPIKDFNETCSLEFVEYRLERPKYDVDECMARGASFQAPVKVVIRLVVWDVNADTGVRSIRDVKEQEVFFGEIPLMTDNGTFIINGTERVIVSQLHRSPGAFLDHDGGKSHSSGKLLYSARIIPYRGSWIDFEFDAKDILHVRIDRRRKLPATVLLRALYKTPPDPHRRDDEVDRTGYTAEEILAEFYGTETVEFGDGKAFKVLDPDHHIDTMASIDVIDPENGEVLVKAKKKLTKAKFRRLKKAGVDRIPIGFEEELYLKYSAEEVWDEETGEIIVEANQQLTKPLVAELNRRNVTSLKVLFIDGIRVGSFLRDTLAVDKVATPLEARLEIYQRLRPGDPPTEDTAESLFENLFYKAERYDLSKVGRLKLNHKFSLDYPLEYTVLHSRDIIETVRTLLEAKAANGGTDDIDHLGNRRVRAVGELLENQYRVGLVRMERAVKEKMSMSQEIETLMPHDLINAKPVTAVVKEYFGGSQLSQFMDQTNPLSEVTHKRRLSALGPGGLTRERAGFEVRDVHTTHYGRICPIETPEGPNIGLIASLATYARVNEYGFIESPYRRVENGIPSDEVRWYSALEEERNNIAQAQEPVDAAGKFVNELVPCRSYGEPTYMSPDEITLMDVAPHQLVSVAAALIPFLEHDDANRALMGSNMQRQAVPLLRTSAPLVGTGMERSVARDSGVTSVARHDGVVESVDAGRIVIKADSDDDVIAARPDIYKLVKYKRSNQSTCINQRPIVREGERVRRGDVIADGPATDRGELALGQNVLVAFMPWNGYNFEDSILISERVVKEDVFTSIHIEEYECVARDTKLGKEEITRDIPNVGDEALLNLDDSGIVRIGAEVQNGDILVGKITPKGETQLSPEEKLLRAIFGEKAGDVRDTSLRMPPGTRGIVIGAKVFSRKGIELDERSKKILEEEKKALLKDEHDEITILRDAAFRRVRELLLGRTVGADLIDDKKKVLLKRGTTLDRAALEEVPRRFWKSLQVDAEIEVKRDQILQILEDAIQEIRVKTEEKIDKLDKGDELGAGVIKMVKVYVAVKRKLQVGDKMAGRHGNKGVVSRILPQEDMPYLEDGTPVDICLNPLGVPSRMNVGQILETHLGWIAWNIGRKVRDCIEREDAATLRELMGTVFHVQKVEDLLSSLSDDEVLAVGETMASGVHFATPVFDGATEEDIQRLYDVCGISSDGKSRLIDGRTGEPFSQKVTVGVMYMLKLHHLVDDKIHARSIGPYSLVTQQPLGGKAQFGGQRLGEMEVWAMEAYGAAYSLQEFLTVKSDDVSGRTRMYENIVKGENAHEAGLPESFNVLMKELQSLCFNVELLEDAS
ncbi:MAG: DNA-directed RNA polymerase subunit beta [Myxococcales bacterium]|nr:DNA-directed RNA polymerase subunit beta [Myxococcales bacterium]MCB9520643.1 DNA-directed RNA polymerase subunit beta [Myxococcales bacterium]